MVFSSLDYFLFLPLALAGYWGLQALERRARTSLHPVALYAALALFLAAAAVPAGVLAAALHAQARVVPEGWFAIGLHRFLGPLFELLRHLDRWHAIEIAAGISTLAWIAALVLTPRREDDATSAEARLRTARFGFGFVSSCLFYMAWSPLYIGLVLSSTIVDYFVARRIAAATVQWKRRAWLIVSLAFGLGLLGFFKYFNFAMSASESVAALFGVRIDAPVLDVLLPVGISFYTFETLSYTIDVYRGHLAPERKFLRFAFFVLFFPHLVAGPIIRAAEFLPQVQRPSWLTSNRISQAIFLIAVGILKKVVLADFISVNLVDRVFDDPQAFTSTEVLIALYGFTLQIYADFSGYTDVARGSALLFGIELPENFDRPYQARSVAEFWRRWHMTLSLWLRDYLYFPLGGSKKGELRTYFNLWVTIFAIGLWHGASWTFVIYGNLQACAVMWNRYCERMASRPQSAAPPSGIWWRLWPLHYLALGWTSFVRAAQRGTGRDPLWLAVFKIALTMQFVVFSRILFRANDLDNARDIVRQLAAGTTSTAQISPDVWRILVLGFYLHYVPREELGRAWRMFAKLPWWAHGLLLAVVLGIVALFVTEDVVPYIYFQF